MLWAQGLTPVWPSLQSSCSTVYFTTSMTIPVTVCLQLVLLAFLATASANCWTIGGWKMQTVIWCRWRGDLAANSTTQSVITCAMSCADMPIWPANHANIRTHDTLTRHRPISIRVFVTNWYENSHYSFRPHCYVQHKMQTTVTVVAWSVCLCICWSGARSVLKRAEPITDQNAIWLAVNKEPCITDPGPHYIQSV